MKGEEKREPFLSEKAKDEVLSAVEKLEGEDGAKISDLTNKIDESVLKTEEILGELLKENKVYEPIKGKFKKLS